MSGPLLNRYSVMLLWTVGELAQYSETVSPRKIRVLSANAQRWRMSTLKSNNATKSNLLGMLFLPYLTYNTIYHETITLIIS